MSTPGPEASEPRSHRPSLRRRAAVGTAWMVTGNTGGQVLRLVGNLILTRLLVPEAFGLIAIVGMLNTGLQMVSDIGMRPNIIQHARGGDQEFLDTAWTIQILRGFLVWAVALSLAIPVAHFYKEPLLAALIAVGSFRAVIDGLTSTKLLGLTRRIELARVSVIGLASKTISLIAMIAIAWPFRTVWALVVGSLAGELLEVILSHFAIPGPLNRLRWHRRYAWEIYRFGRWILASTLFTFLSRRIDVVMLGRLVPMSVLGVYSIGLLISSVPDGMLSIGTDWILMPALAEVRRDRLSAFDDTLAKSKRLLLLAAGLCVVGCVAVAPAFFRYLYDPRYWDAGWIAQLSMIPFWFTVLHTVNGRVLLVLGDSRSMATSNVAKAVVAFIACLGGFYWMGLAGVLLGLGVGSASAYATVAIALRSHRVGTQRIDLLVTLGCATLGLACAAGPWMLAAKPDIDRIALVTVLAGAIMLIPSGAGFAVYAWRTLAR